MTPEQLEIERAKFEAWVRSKSTSVPFDILKRCDSGQYVANAVDGPWNAWQAAVESREWVDLTDDEIGTIVDGITHRVAPMACFRAIETKLKEKNNA